VELLRGVVGGGGELPVVAAVPAGGVPRRTDRLPAQLDGEGVVLVGGQVLEQAAKGQRGRADPGTEPGRVEAVGLPAERVPQPVERPDQVVDLGTGDRWLPGNVGHPVTLDTVTDVLLPERPGLPGVTRVGERWIDGHPATP